MKISTKIIQVVISTTITLLFSIICNGQTTVTFNCTGAAQNWTVPACVTSINVTVEGAQGGGPTGGLGAVVTATLPVTPGQVLQINVGCVGGCPGTGFNGGGAGQGASGPASNASCGGGGASDIRIAPYGLGNRLIVAGGGGGTGGGDANGTGGNAGCASGSAGGASFGLGGNPGTATAGGSGGPAWGGGNVGLSGGLGVGGAGASDPCYNVGPGGGGGGGYYGGGGGGSDCWASSPLGGGGGGGGSSLTPAGGACGGTNTGPGVVTISYTGGSLTPTVNSPTICAGGFATLTATGGTTYTWSTGATTNPLNVAPAVTTSYTVTASTAGCTGTAVSTVTVNPTPIVTPEPNLTYCAGATVPANGFVSTPGGATFNWTNSNPAIGLAASGTGGLPSFIATNTTGAPITATISITPTLSGCNGPISNFTITVNPIPVTTVTSTTICPGATATLTASGATTYSWSTGSTANPINVSPAATTSYTVTGTTSGCSSTAVSTVNVAAAMVVTVNSATICAGQSATLTATGATTYAWNTGATTNPLNVTPATTTTYTVTGTTSGCTGSAVSTVTVNPLPVTTVNSPTVCAGVTANLTAGGASSYTWSAGATSTGVNTADATPLTTTSYTVTGTTSGCTSTAVSTVTVNPIPVTTVNSPTICPGTTATMTAGGATTYTWTAGATPTGANTADATPASTTSYTVTGTSLGCSSTAVSTVTVNAAMVVNAGPNDSVCFGGSIVLNVTPNGAGYTYNWTPTASLTGATTQTPTASPTANTTYTVLVTDPSGCTGTGTVTIFADPQITMAIAGIDVTCNGACNGQTIVIPAGGSPGYTYLWNTGCTGASCSSLCPGTYTVTVTDTWGCTATSSTTVIEPTLLTASLTGSTPASCNAACDGTATAAGAGGTVGGGYTYSWNTVPAQTTATATGLCAGSYTCTVTDANGCTATTTVTITEPTLVVIAPIAPVTICASGSTTLTAVPSGGNGTPYVCTWLPAGTGSTASVTVSPATTTTYTVSAVDNNGCPSAPVTVTVTVNPGLTVVATGTTSICPGASAPLSATASAGNGGPYTYSWSPATGLSSATANNPTASPAATTVYTVTASDGCSPTATATVTVTVLPLPVVTFSADVTSGCAPVCVNFTDNSTVAGGSIAGWNWTIDGTTFSSANPSHCFANPGSYDISLTVTSNGGCTASSTINNMITVHPVPNAAFTAPDNTSIVTPTVQFIDLSANASQWSWNFMDPFAGADSVSSLQNPSHTYTEPGTYCVTLFVSSPFGCTDSTIKCITIDPEFTLFIPSAFSPNGDGVNDEFYAKGDFIKKFEMSIYDRWGNLIYFSDDINKHWDGKANHGQEVSQQDVYVYSINLTDNKEKKHKYVGTVTIVK